MRALATFVVLASALMSSGCASQIGYGRARVLEPRQQQLSGAVEVDFASPKAAEDGSAIHLPWLQLGAGYRRGLLPSFEIAGRVWGFGFPEHLSIGGSLDGKVQLLRSPTSKRGLDLALGQSVMYHHVELGGAPWHVFGATVPLLFGVNLDDNQIVFGPRIGGLIWTAYGQDSILLPWFGASFGVSVQAKKHIQVMPEAVLTYVPASFNGEVDGPRTGATQLQLGLNVAFDL